MIKKGDMVNPTTHARVNYKVDTLNAGFPCEVVNVFQTGDKTVAQFLCNDQYSKTGGLALRSWDVRNLEVVKPPKPRYKLVPVSAVSIGDIVVVVSRGRAGVSQCVTWASTYKLHTTLYFGSRSIDFHTDFKVWKKVKQDDKATPEKDTRAPDTSGSAYAWPGRGREIALVPCGIRPPGLDVRPRNSDAVQCEGRSASANNSEAVCGRGPTLRMKLCPRPGDKLVLNVTDVNGKPCVDIGGVKLLLDPGRYYNIIS